MNHLKGVTFAFDALHGLTKEERRLFSIFKANLEQELPDHNLDDTTLRRFFAADRTDNGFEINKSIIRLRHTLVWRAKEGVDSILLKPPASVKAYQALRVRCFFGVDRQHRPVQFERLGEFFALGNASNTVLSHEQ